MAWHLLKSGGEYMEYGAANKEFQIDSETDIQTEPTEFGAIAIGSKAHLAGYTKEWEKGPNGWTDYNPGGYVDPSAVTDAVEDWLDDHPEATTTVQDGSITKAKLNSSLQDTVDEVDALRSAITQLDGAVEELEQGSLSALGATAGQVPTAKGDGTWEWSGGAETVSGSTPTIVAVAGMRYECGEVSTIDFTPSATGVCDVVFTSGSTPAVLTIPNTVKFPSWFDPTSLDADTTYEINVLNGTLGAVMAWA